MLEYSECKIEKVSAHKVGNKINEEELILSKEELDIGDGHLRGLLVKYFLGAFENPEFYSFTFLNDDFNRNPLFNFVSSIFDNREAFQNKSIDIAKQLYEASVHPQIKSGDLFVVYFSDIIVEGEMMDAVGIFKSENKQAFLNLEESEEKFSLKYDDGINIEKLDKGCLILNLEKEDGYRICIVDRSNKSSEAQYWRDDFLKLKPCSDDFYYTKQFMNVTKQFIANQVVEEFEVNKADQIDLLNRSVAYFKTHDNFVKNEFEAEVFKDKQVIESFENFNNSFSESSGVELTDNFEISPQAVKAQARIFKSVLKLDKNFHVYIHGNRELIQQGTDPDGRKFYKIFYNEEK
jgi:37-kD nucleoid-associated bacterial protein